MLLSILNEFIFEGILSKIVIMENDSSERKGYSANLAKNNEKNNLYHAIRSVNIHKLCILSSYIYTDVNKSR